MAPIHIPTRVCCHDVPAFGTVCWKLTTFLASDDRGFLSGGRAMGSQPDGLVNFVPASRPGMGGDYGSDGRGAPGVSIYPVKCANRGFAPCGLCRRHREKAQKGSVHQRDGVVETPRQNQADRESGPDDDKAGLLTG